jgi:hypothetical protein
MQMQSLAQVCRCYATFSRGLLDPMELPNVRAAVFVAALNDEYVAIQFERPRLIRPCDRSAAEDALQHALAPSNGF